MRLFLLLLISILAFAGEYPRVFASAGDEIYEDMVKYEQIKDLDIYQDRPELLEAFLEDAKRALMAGFELDKAEDDPEVSLDKQALKAYARALRDLSKQNDNIKAQVQRDMHALLEAKDTKHLTVFQEAGFVMTPTMLALFKVEKAQVKSNSEKKNLDKKIAQLNKKNKKIEKQSVDRATSSTVEVVEMQAPVSFEQEVVEEEIPVVIKKPEPPKVLTEIERYQQSLEFLKEELYELRESNEKAKMACLNDITAMNYWMLKVLENEKDACVFSEAIRQMKTYDKSASESCGRSSMRYVEWHGRIKPYVGKRLFQAEALCHP